MSAVFSGFSIVKAKVFLNYCLLSKAVGKKLELTSRSTVLQFETLCVK